MPDLKSSGMDFSVIPVGRWHPRVHDRLQYDGLMRVCWTPSSAYDAIIRASANNWLVMVVLMDQPTTQRENRSITT